MDHNVIVLYVIYLPNSMCGYLVLIIPNGRSVYFVNQTCSSVLNASSISNRCLQKITSCLIYLSIIWISRYIGGLVREGHIHASRALAMTNGVASLLSRATDVSKLCIWYYIIKEISVSWVRMYPYFASLYVHSSMFNLHVVFVFTPVGISQCYLLYCTRHEINLLLCYIMLW